MADSSGGRFPKIVIISFKAWVHLNQSLCMETRIEKIDIPLPLTDQSAHEEGSLQCSNMYAAEIGAQKLPLGHNQHQLLKCGLGRWAVGQLKRYSIHWAVKKIGKEKTWEVLGESKTSLDIICWRKSIFPGIFPSESFFRSSKPRPANAK